MRQYLRSAILGGVDGVITSFAIVAGASFLSAPGRVVAVVGSSSLLADGASMGVSEYLSTRSEQMLTRRSARGVSALHGLACLGSFVACGALPLIVFVAGDSAILGATSAAFVVLLLLGCFRAAVTEETLLWCLLETSGLGSVATGLAFAVAAVTSGLVDE
jgi:VIT1/CCC1 family predicted Fe2+/Mn2+ transporter